MSMFIASYVVSPTTRLKPGWLWVECISISCGYGTSDVAKMNIHNIVVSAGFIFVEGDRWGVENQG